MKNMKLVQRYSFPQNRFKCLWPSQRLPASVEVKSSGLKISQQIEMMKNSEKSFL